MENPTTETADIHQADNEVIAVKKSPVEETEQKDQSDEVTNGDLNGHHDEENDDSAITNGSGVDHEEKFNEPEIDNSESEYVDAVETVTIVEEPVKEEEEPIIEQVTTTTTFVEEEVVKEEEYVAVEEPTPTITTSSRTTGEPSLQDRYISVLDKVLIAQGFQKGYTFEVESATKTGDDFMGEVLRVSVNGVQSIDGKTNSSELKLIFKMAPEGADGRTQINSIPVFEREAFMYNKVLPAIIEFQQSKDIPFELGFFNFPHCYAVVCDPEEDVYVIVMEDLQQWGYKMWDKLKPVDYDHMKLGLMRLARFHAVSFAMKAQQPELFKELSDLDDNLYKGIVEHPDKYVPFIEQCMSQSLECLNYGEEFKIEKILELKSNIVKYIGSCVGPDGASRFKVINHGDCWINNMMYAYDEAGDPCNINIVDWQMSRYGSPVLDIVYFIFASTDKRFRDHHYTIMLQLYCKSFSEHLERLGGKANQFTYQHLQNELKIFGKYGVIMASMLLPMVTSEPDTLHDMDRLAALLIDNPNAMMDMGSETRDPKYTKRMSDVIRDAISLGYL